MDKNDIYFFELLKKKVSETFLEKNNGSSQEIKHWKGEEITLFQEDLFAKVRARVSEKWFYTYFKNSPGKLPRIDMLNLLSEYTGFENWNTFRQQHEKTITKKTFVKPLLYLSAILLLAGCYKWMFMNNTYDFKFCFVDAIKNESITNTRLDIMVLKDNESPIYYKTDSLGCFDYHSKDESITFIVKSPYHKTDTITRSVSSTRNSTVKVTTDDYALMLDYYVNGKIKDWKKHKNALHKIIAEDAQIYRLFGNDIGIEVYGKEDFIRLSTTPTSTLKRIKILEKQMQGEKIVKLKFMVI